MMSSFQMNVILSWIYQTTMWKKIKCSILIRYMQKSSFFEHSQWKQTVLTSPWLVDPTEGSRHNHWLYRVAVTRGPELGVVTLAIPRFHSAVYTGSRGRRPVTLKCTKYSIFQNLHLQTCILKWTYIEVKTLNAMWTFKWRHNDHRTH